MHSKRKLKWNSTSGSSMSYIKSENRTSNRSYSFLILTENNLNNIFKRAYKEGKNHAVKLKQSNDYFKSDVPATYYKVK